LRFGAVKDVWFWDKMKASGGRFPSVDTVSDFVVDHIWAEKLLGYHSINKGLLKDRAEDIYA